MGRVGWLALAAVSGALLLVASSFTRGGCYDSADDPASSYCFSEPMLTVPGLWVGWISWTALAGYCLYRAVSRPAER